MCFWTAVLGPMSLKQFQEFLNLRMWQNVLKKENRKKTKADLSGQQQ